MLEINGEKSVTVEEMKRLQIKFAHGFLTYHQGCKFNFTYSFQYFEFFLSSIYEE